MKNLFFFLLMAGLTSMFSCTPEQGEIGPTGPAGQDGINGTNGQDGQDGTNGQDGKNGNANIKSYVTTFDANDWVTYNSNIRYVELQVANITENVANNGLVVAYFRDLNSFNWHALPFSVVNNNRTQTYYYYVAPGILRLHSTSDGTPDSNGLYVRIITATPEGLARYPDLDWTNYEAVCEAMNLAE